MIPNLDTMTIAQLEQLMESIRKEKNKKCAAHREATIQKLAGNGKLKKLQEEYQEFVEGLKALEGQTEYKITVPIVFTVTTELYEMEEDLFHVYEGDMKRIEDHLFDTNYEAKIVGSELSKKQKALLQDGLNEIVGDACDLIQDLFPDHQEKSNKLKKQFNTLKDKLTKLDLTVEDLN